MSYVQYVLCLMYSMSYDQYVLCLMSGTIYQMVENFAELSEQSWPRLNGQVVGRSEVEES